MSKLLSIIIPTYNMEAYLARCLDSLLASPECGQLDILVVNDGSKDRSLEIARQYEAAHLGVVRVVDKSNGNYGSTINAALPIAAGRYVKILDADDTFDTDALTEYLRQLKTLEADLVVCHFTNFGRNGQREVIKYNTMSREVYDYGRVYDADEVLGGGYIRFFLMHAIAYRTDLLRSIGYRQTEGISYTDTEWACYPVFYVRTIVFLNVNLYLYNNDREGQTMDPKVLLKSVSQLDKVTEQMFAYYEAHIDEPQISPARRAFFKQYFENRLRILYKIYLMDMPRADFDAAALSRFESKYRPVMERRQLQVRLYPENKLIRYEYIRHWQRTRQRPPLWFERCNAVVDRVVKWAYRNFVRR
jgi:glycosyltransferase involved in cell wall biosynthesis